MYKMVDISDETWINTEVSAIKIHGNINKTLLKLLCISGNAKKSGTSLQNHKSESIK